MGYKIWSCHVPVFVEGTSTPSILYVDPLFAINYRVQTFARDLAQYDLTVLLGREEQPVSPECHIFF